MGRPVSFFITGVDNYSDGYFAYKDDDDNIYEIKNFKTREELPRDYNPYTDDQNLGRPYEIDDIAKLPLAPSIDDLAPELKEKRIMYYQKLADNKIYINLYSIEYLSPTESRTVRIGEKYVGKSAVDSNFACYVNYLDKYNKYLDQYNRNYYGGYTYLNVRKTENIFRTENFVDVKFVENSPQSSLSKFLGMKDYRTFKTCVVSYPNEVRLGGGGKKSRKRSRRSRRKRSLKSPRRKSIRR
jgi:hypothetical protein